MIHTMEMLFEWLQQTDAKAAFQQTLIKVSGDLHMAYHQNAVPPVVFGQERVLQEMKSSVFVHLTQVTNLNFDRLTTVISSKQSVGNNQTQVNYNKQVHGSKTVTVKSAKYDGSFHMI